MDINLTIALITLLFAITGFVSYEYLLIRIWRSSDNETNSWFDDLFNYRKPESHGACYDKCMTELHWDPSQVATCAAGCKI